ncbi:Mitochondrial inner membrane protease subunit 1 [Colletotrichum chlorophyti]|uniref:Mitochondrial inner membrane protease subunit n=1 Tax=Colletotrichum chlorophyti TaxID=708187 RepID=A0A1Q8RKL8_9PEZI|nr:Mitochondrial inner membrane protease subunit 1 [Colletotrichum chlorophyti]
MAGNPFRLFLTVGKTICAAHLFLDYGMCAAPASGPSMLPTFEVTGEWFLTDPRHRRGRDIAVGDLVTYRIPIFPLSRSEGVKRVLGLPGDYVLLGSPDSKKPIMMQVRTDERHSALGLQAHVISVAEGVQQVPQGHCWLVGDNLESSRDSRMYGPVPLALIKGKVVARLLPLSKEKKIENPLRDVDNSRG